MPAPVPVARPSSPSRRAALLLPAVLLAAGCLPPARPPASAAGAPTPVRVRLRGAPDDATGTLLRLDADSVVWRPAGGAAPRAHALADVARVEVAERLTQRDALKRGLVRGALVGAALGGVLLAVRPDAVGGAVGLVLGGAWVTGVLSGQQVESPQPPVRWRVAHPRDGRSAP